MLNYLLMAIRIMQVIFWVILLSGNIGEDQKLKYRVKSIFLKKKGFCQLQTKIKFICVLGN
jgi:hypothetical protein